MIALAGPAQADPGDQCAQVQLDQTGSCNILGANSFANGSNAPPSGTNKSGNAGFPGGQAGSITHTFQDPGSYYSVPEGLQPAALMGSYSGNGGEGGDASNGSNKTAPVQNLNAGNGGIGMPGGGVTFISPTGAQVLFLGTGGQLGADSVAIWAESVGGNGGGGGLPTEGGLPGTSATGGAGGDVSVTISNSASTFDPLTGVTGSIVADGIGILARSTGGNGGVGHSHILDFAKAGVDGGTTTGTGGKVTVTVDTNITLTGVGNLSVGQAFGAGVLAVSAGGNGGDGGTGSDIAPGGNGGFGGGGAPGGTVNVTVTGNGSINAGTLSVPNNGLVGMPAIFAQSLGGYGGSGANGGRYTSGGDAGPGADGGAVNVTNNGALTTSYSNSPGILAQSLGGAGANGGTGGGWGASGGEGATGGDGGPITILGNGGSIGTPGTNSPGILAQSIGGGGGSGGDSNGWLALGGQGLAAGNGGSVSINIQNSITTSGERSAGILAQSIGGGGGNGGNASGSGLGLNLTIGANGGAGGSGSVVQAASSGIIATSGAHSSGLVLQSIGGGGGNGGAAYSKDTSGGAGASVAVGGTGANGGLGGSVGQFISEGNPLATNAGRITTTGSDSFGILAQSIGGGGGVGGAATSSTITYAVSTDPPLPTLSLSVALGGSGGSGNDSGTVTLVNAGLIATSGQGSAGIVAQSIGGGGGNGGDSSSAATAKSGSDTPFTFSGSISLGGSGNGGGNANTVTATNSGLILTSGESADGMLLQSIGGGGGNGGSGDAKAKSTGDATGISTSVAVGGSGGGGGGGGMVTATNQGSILTLGDGAAGIIAQSVGGGGGRGGGAAGTSNGNFSAVVNLGGQGGPGGNGGPSSGNAVSVTNNGYIVTFGADAPGIVAQGIGGGGGVGGKAASSLGSSKSTGDGGNGAAGSVSATTQSLNAAFQAGGLGALAQYNSVAGLTNLANGALGNASLSMRPLGDVESDASGLESTGESAGNSGDGSNAKSITIQVGVGGQGGYGGTGEPIYVHNTGGIGTIGSHSDGILAQSIGGGGGKGGAAISSAVDSVVDTKKVKSSISVGGSGGAGGTAESVTVTNDGSIITIGGLSAGIVAQSIAGGGGIAGVSGSKASAASAASLLAIPISIGGDGGHGDSSGQVTVTNNGSIITRSHDAIGIIGQSISGGGGIVKTLSTDAADNNGGGASPNGGDYGINLTFAGDSSKQNGAGNAAPVGITNTGSITTSGRNAYGILAQSIGGGGGLVLGGKPVGPTFFGSGQMMGDGSSVTVETSGAINTSGAGAVGIFAQSIGGGGGLAGDTAWTEELTPFNDSGSTHIGNGGPVKVTVDQGGSVTTTGFAAPAILVQSLGGGGGRVSNTTGAYNGTVNGTGNGGKVTITVNGNVQAQGQFSAGIYAQSAGHGGAGTAGSVIQITVGSNGLVSGGPGGGSGIFVDSGSASSANPNTVTNYGTVTTATGISGFAVYSQTGVTQVDNYGTMTGRIGTPTGTSNVVNHLGGTFNTGAQVSLGGGSFRNQGMLSIGGTGPVASTRLTGAFVQESTGTLRVDTDHVAGQSDHLDVVGTASVAGNITVHPIKLAKRAVTVLTASEGLTLDPSLSANRTPVFSYSTSRADNTLVLTPQAAFATSVPLSDTQRQVAMHLQQIWDTGASLGTGFAALASINDAASYARALDSLSGQTVGAIAAFRFASSRNFINNLYSCPNYAPGSMQSTEGDCAWMRILGNQSGQDSTTGALGYSASSVTTQLGWQKQFAPNWFYGLSLAYEHSRFGGAQKTSSVTGDGLLAGAVLKYETGPWLLSGGLNLGYGWYSSSRLVSIGSSFAAIAQANPSAWHVGANGRVAYQIPFEHFYLKPMLDVNAIYVGSSAYTETGAAPFNLAVRSGSAGAVSATAAVEIGTLISLGAVGTLHPYASVGVGALSGNGWSATAHFAGVQSGSFSATTPIPNLVGRVTAGADLIAGENWKFKLQYNGDVGAYYHSHTGSARISYAF
ncbi:MAG: hypothetical protein AB7O80_13580 [Acetobacteraceae bacterium]